MVNVQLYSPVVDQNVLIFPAYTIMAGGVAITIFGIVGCMGAMNDNKCYMSFVSTSKYFYLSHSSAFGA